MLRSTGTQVKKIYFKVSFKIIRIRGRKSDLRHRVANGNIFGSTKLMNRNLNYLRLANPSDYYTEQSRKYSQIKTHGS
jgi:hypothetical protein